MKTRHRAILDPDGIYRGHEPATGKMGAAEVEVPADCDLDAGGYRWDGESFVPVRATQPEDLVGEPHTLAAIAAALMAVRDAGTELPDISNRWLDWYAKSIDAKGVLPVKKV